MVQGELTVVIGGVRSGKSIFAEQLLVKQATSNGGRLIYIASGEASDAEMQARIDRHRKDRSDNDWLTIEQPTEMEQVLTTIQQGDYILWDCMTTWLANEFYVGWKTGTPCIQQVGCIDRKVAKLYKTIEKIRCNAAHFVIVSNEVLDEQPSIYPETRLYSKWLGNIHEEIVAQSTTAIEMDAGIAIVHKRKGGTS